MNRYPDLPPIWAAGIAVLAIFASMFLPIISFFVPEFVVWIFLLTGFGLIIWSGYFFWRKKTTIEPHHKPTSLIVEGPYRISRNPIYLGMFLGVLGVALWSGGLSGVIVACVFPIIISRRFIASEEQMLKEQFKDEAETYIDRTARWLVV